MERIWTRVDDRAGRSTFGERAVGLPEILGPLEAGEPPARTAEALDLEPADLIAALAFAALGGEASEGPPLIQAAPAHPGLARVLDEPAWAPLFPRADRPARLALAAGLLQMHDFWEASHEAAQQADDLGERRVSAYWHGIAHRREPDAGNASYWFRRVGPHPIFAALARGARPLLEAHGDAGLTSRLLPGDDWNSSAMIDLCTQRRPSESVARVARQLQRLEMILLLESTCQPL